MNVRNFRVHSRPLPLIWILAVFSCTFFIYRDFGFRMIYGYALLGVVLILHLYDRLRLDEPVRLDYVSLASAALAGIITLHFLLPGARRDEDTFAYVASMLICSSYVFAAPGHTRNASLAAAAMYSAAMTMAAFVVVFTLLPELFRQTVYPLLSVTARHYYDFFQPLGYGVSLGTYSYTDYVLFLGIVICAADLASGRRTAVRIAVNGASISFMLLAMVFLGRRGELLAAVVAVALFVLALCSRRNRRIVLITGSILCIICGALVLAFLPELAKIPVLYRYVETIQQILSGIDFTAGRGALQRAAIRGFLSSPLFGVGWGQYLRLSAEVGMCDTDGNLIEDCHNIYLQFLCETGIVGTVLILIPVFYLMYTACRMLHHAKSLEDKTALRFASVSFLIQFFLLFLGLYDPSFQKVVFWCFYGVALMFLRAAMRRSGWCPDDPLSKLLDRILGRLRPVCSAVWQFFRTPWKEGT